MERFEVDDIIRKDIENAITLIKLGSLDNVSELIRKIELNAPSYPITWFVKAFYNAETAFRECKLYDKRKSSKKILDECESSIHMLWDRAKLCCDQGIGSEINEKFLELMNSVKSQREMYDNERKEFSNLLVNHIYTIPKAVHMYDNKFIINISGYDIEKEISNLMMLKIEYDRFYSSNNRIIISLSDLSTLSEDYKFFGVELRKFIDENTKNIESFMRLTLNQQDIVIKAICGIDTFNQIKIFGGDDKKVDNSIKRRWKVTLLNGRTLIALKYDSDGDFNHPFPLQLELRGNLDSIINEQSMPKEGCFVATAVYGSYESPEVIVLRQFRDDVLSNYFFGRLFIRLYYYFSPQLIKRIKHRNGMMSLIKIVLDKFVNYLKICKNK